MLVARRLAALRQLARQVQRGGRPPPQNAKKESSDRSGAFRERILLRRGPIAVSLLERSLLSLDRQFKKLSAADVVDVLTEGDHAVDNVVKSGDGVETQKKIKKIISSCEKASLPTGKAAFAANGALAAETMHILSVLEKERRILFGEKQRETARRLRVAQTALQQFRREFTAKQKPTASSSSSSLRLRERKAAPQSVEEKALIDRTKTALRERVDRIFEDQMLLKRSLLSRPLLSARLWRLLLAERVWVGAVQLQRQESARAGGRADNNKTSDHHHFLLYISLLFSRLVVGVVKDYVDGSEVSRRSPRFVVSLPSASFREKARKAATEHDCTACSVESSDFTANVQRNPETEAADDLMALMFGETIAAPPPNTAISSVSTPSTPAVAAATRARNKRRQFSLRWTPPHSADVLPLLVDTLAMFAFLLPQLDTAALATAGLAAEVVSLLSSLQKLATTALILSSGNDSRQSSPQLHEALRRLEDNMLAVGHQLRHVCAANLRDEQKHQRHASAPARQRVFSNVPPAKAARMLVELDALRLLHTTSANDDAAVVLDALTTAVFPELKTNTVKTLMEKSRQSSLLSFATKGHRQKLYKEHGSRAKAEKYLLGTIVQRSRLEQRKMAAALRDQHLTNTHLQFVTELGRTVPACDLIALFRLLVTRITAASADRDYRAEALGCLAAQTSRLTAASLFVAETLLVSGAFNEDATLSTRGAVTGDDMVQFWTMLATLWPVVDARRELLLQQRRQDNSGASSSLMNAPDAKTETAILSFATEMVLTSINGSLAALLQSVKAAQEVQRERPQATATDLLNAEQLATLAMGLLVWHEVDPERRRHRSFAVTQQVELSQKLLREVLLKDTAVWREVRRWDLEKRAAFERRLLECFRAANLLDNATTRAVQKACSSL